MYEDNFWGRVKERCNQKGLSLRRMASETGLNYHVMTNQVTHGTIPKKPGVCEAMAKELDCTVQYLVSGEEGCMIKLSKEMKDFIDDYKSLDDNGKMAVQYLMKYLIAVSNK